MTKKPFAIMVMGRTASGKTTTSKYLSQALGIEHISFSEHKRLATNNNYTISDCFRQDLRDTGYNSAMEYAKLCLLKKQSVILDASFYQRSRRIWVYEQISSLCNLLVRIYCLTSDIIETRSRISERKGLESLAEFQASDFSAFEFIHNNFEEPSRNEYNDTNLNIAEFEVDTFQGIVKKKGDLSEIRFPAINSINSSLNLYLSTNS